MSEWRQFAKKHYEELKKSDPETTFGQALKSAAKKWKKSKGGDGEETVVPAQRKSKKGGDGEVVDDASATEAPIAQQKSNKGGDGEVTTDAPVAQQKSKKGGNAPSQRKSKRKNRKSRRTRRR